MTPAEVQAARERMRCSQVEFARRLGVSLRTVQYWLSSKDTRGPCCNPMREFLRTVKTDKRRKSCATSPNP